ncbi:MAG: DUF2961 domain-containing protein [candidate division KSB1 bacterium]|nr:DUF2961 domain-containing protein [candidate division KSB1 bacterium]
MKPQVAMLVGMALASVIVSCERADLEEDPSLAWSRLKDFRAARASSFDRTGGNDDGNWGHPIQPGETRELAVLTGPGVIEHIWFTIASDEPYHLKKLVLRVYWDNEDRPSVEAPVGDFFGLGHGEYHHFVSEPIAIGTQNALNCFWPMPFRRSARLTITNEGEKMVRAFYYQIDWAKLSHWDKNLAYFHAQYRQAYPCQRVVWKEGEKPVNLKGEKNYVFLEAEGAGHYVGVVLNVRLNEDGWWGEGDDMIFVDGDSLPTLSGTGSEDYFCGAWGFGKAFSYPYFGCPVNQAEQGNQHQKGAKWTVYRFHLRDPIPFRRSIRVTIEHGHANDRADDWCSVAFWYQKEPHAPFPPLPPVSERLPRPLD